MSGTAIRAKPRACPPPHETESPTVLPSAGVGTRADERRERRLLLEWVPQLTRGNADRHIRGRSIYLTSSIPASAAV